MYEWEEVLGVEIFVIGLLIWDSDGEVRWVYWRIFFNYFGISVVLGFDYVFVITRNLGVIFLKEIFFYLNCFLKV